MSQIRIRLQAIGLSALDQCVRSGAGLYTFHSVAEQLVFPTHHKEGVHSSVSTELSSQVDVRTQSVQEVNRLLRQGQILVLYRIGPAL